MRLCLALAVAFVLNGCAQQREHADSTAEVSESLPETLAVRGNEPFWLASVTADAIDLTTPAEEQQLLVKARARTSSHPPRWRFTTHDGTELVLTQALCRDSMSGKAYPYTAKLIQADGVHPGCGGETQTLLKGVLWQSVDVATVSKPATLTFLDNGKLAGFDGCNQFTGHYSVAGETPRLQVMAQTRRMCPKAAMKYAETVLSLLNNVVKLDINGSSITITAESGQTRVFEPRSR